MHTPYAGGFGENPELEEATEAVRVFLNRLAVEVIVVLWPPHPRYITAPCCDQHMAGWNQTHSPQALFQDLELIDKQLEDKFRGIANGAYISLQEIAGKLGCRRKTALEVWKGLVNNTSLFLTNPAMKGLLEIVLTKGTDPIQLSYLAYHIEQKK